MSLAHPSLTTTGRPRGRVKFKSSQEAQQARKLEQDWKLLQQRWGVEADTKKRNRAMQAETLVYSLSAPAGRETVRHGSVDTGHLGAVASKPIPKYTGDKILGIGTLHKSNGVPVFSEQEATEIARMRRG